MTTKWNSTKIPQICCGGLFKSKLGRYRTVALSFSPSEVLTFIPWSVRLDHWRRVCSRHVSNVRARIRAAAECNKANSTRAVNIGHISSNLGTNRAGRRKAQKTDALSTSVRQHLGCPHLHIPAPPASSRSHESISHAAVNHPSLPQTQQQLCGGGRVDVKIFGSHL